MKVKLNILFEDARGKFGNAFVASNTGRGTNVLRTYVNPIQPNSTAQIEQRTIFTNCVNGWKNLTAEERNGWELYANYRSSENVFNQPINRTPSQWFIQINTGRQIIGEAVTSTAPPLAYIDPIDTSGVLGSVSWVGDTPTFTGLEVPSGAYIVLWATPQYRGANKSPKRSQIIAKSGDSFDNDAIKEAYDSVFELVGNELSIKWEIETYETQYGTSQGKRALILEGL